MTPQRGERDNLIIKFSFMFFLLHVDETVLESPTPSSRLWFRFLTMSCHPYFSFYFSMIQIRQVYLPFKNLLIVYLLNYFMLKAVSFCMKFLLLQINYIIDPLNLSLSFPHMLQKKLFWNQYFTTIRIIHYIKLKYISILCRS